MYIQHNLISSVSGSAKSLDIKLINPWGIVRVGCLLWVAANGTRLLLAYKALSLETSLVTTGSPTGIVSAKNTRFDAEIITVTEEGTIEIYRPSVSGTRTVVVYTVTNTAYKGAAIMNNLLYVANFTKGSVDVFDSDFMPIDRLSIIDESLRAISYNPFNVYASECEGRLYISYAKKRANSTDNVCGVGKGYVSVFSGGTLSRLVNRGSLNSPWGMTLKDGSLVVGNFGDGTMNIYKEGGTVTNSRGRVIVNDGLWGITLDKNGAVLFAAGQEDESQGLVGLLFPRCDTEHQ